MGFKAQETEYHQPTQADIDASIAKYGRDIYNDFDLDAPVFNDQHYVYTLTQDADSTPVTSYLYPGTDQRITVGGAFSTYIEDRKWHSHEVNISSSNDSA